MAKRPGEFTEGDLSNLKNGERAGSTAKLGEATTPVKDGMGEFEDPYEDEMESDGEVVEAETESEMEEDEDDEAMDVDTEAYRISRPQEPLGKDEVLEPDPSAFHMLHNMGTKWPCLSFDIIPDNLGDNRQTYPATVYLVTGTQASKPKDNEITVMKLSSLSRMKQDPEDSDEDSDSDDDDNDDDPILESRHIPVSTTTNRIRTSSTPSTRLAAAMLETGNVNIYNISPHFTSLESPGHAIPPSANQPLASFSMHRGVEGYAIDWSPLTPGTRLLTGDNAGKIFHTTATDGGKFTTDGAAFTGHTSSVEEIQWSPAERTVFASASADGTVKIWDVRQRNRRHVLSVDVSSSDVNVASWNATTQHLLATGADDGVWAVWDLRTFSASSNSNITPVASFTWHQQPITSVEWNPNDDTVVAVGSADGTVTLWNLAVEEDAEEDGGYNSAVKGAGDAPDQLMFEHYCEGVREVHWMRQMPGVVVATGEKGFSVFKTISV
ncbi:ribosome biosynthesis protein rrb1 [Orbilia brochopaga]|uniref:Glutamate-rich WD repeat-containing protein 1 n=1 Tax=Orbilia brochopaga TaxID=3140254 RepID=A0AAV9U107_9PEZI